MSDEKLESFKAGDLQRPGPAPKAVKPKEAAAQAQQDAEEHLSLGFSRIEGILDNDTPEQAKAKLTALIEELDKYSSNASAKDKAQASKAKSAIERTQALLDYLFQTKEAITQGLDSGG